MNFEKIIKKIRFNHIDKNTKLEEKEFYCFFDSKYDPWFELAEEKLFVLNKYFKDDDFCINKFNNDYFIDVQHKIPNFLWFYKVLTTSINEASLYKKEDYAWSGKQLATNFKNLTDKYNTYNQIVTSLNHNGFFKLPLLKFSEQLEKAINKTQLNEDEQCEFLDGYWSFISRVEDLYYALHCCKKIFNHTLALFNEVYNEAYNKIDNENDLNGLNNLIDLFYKDFLNEVVENIYNREELRYNKKDLRLIDSLDANNNGTDFNIIIEKEQVKKLVGKIIKYKEYPSNSLKLKTLEQWLTNIKDVLQTAETETCKYLCINFKSCKNSSRDYIDIKVIPLSNQKIIKNAFKHTLAHSKQAVFILFHCDYWYKTKKYVLKKILEHNEELLPDFLKDDGVYNLPFSNNKNIFKR